MKDSIENKVISILSSSKPTSIKFIAKKLFISESTARRYVNALAKNELVIRTHGGCVPCAKVYENNLPSYFRLTSDNEAKNLIAKHAQTLIKDGDTLFLDSSSTVYNLASYLRTKNNLTVITSGLKTATLLVENNIKTYCLGGLVNYNNLSTNSAYALEFIKNINADLFFFSCDGLNSDGYVCDNSFDECVLRKEFMKQAKTSVLLIDESKINKLCKYNLCPTEKVDIIISNKDEKVVYLNNKKSTE